jgi:hypothetical protein
MFIKEPIEIHTINMAVDDLVKIGTSCNLFNKKPVEEGINDFLERQQVEKILINPILVQINDVLVNLVRGINFLEIFLPLASHHFPSTINPDALPTP